ncbi:hypothetical protein G9A89_018475 [Geosiphon pyriformis]|nr:hypothetical protein G9A89_018475 [Geosiphon pyriformis]
MELISSSAGSSDSSLAGLETCLTAKNKCVDTVYSCGASYKKPKKPAAGVVLDSSTGPLDLEDIGGASVKPVVFWSSKVSSVLDSVSNLLNIKNMTNMIAEETSFVELGEDDDMDDTTPRKTRTYTYVLGSPPKQPSFNFVNFDDGVLELSLYVDFGFNQCIPIKSCVLETHSFNSTKLFVLDIDLSAVSGKTNVDKLAKLLALSENILVNNDLKKITSCTDQEIIIKEIPVDLSKSVIEAVFSKFGKIISIRMQLISLWQKAVVEFESAEIACLVAFKWSVFVRKNFVHVALVVNDKESWISRDCYYALLYTLLIDMTAHDLSNLVETYSEKTCVIGRNFMSYVHVQCTVICFESEAAKLAAIGSVSVFKGVNLRWAGLCLAYCTKYKQFSHVTAICPIEFNWLAFIEESKHLFCVLCLKTWAQVASSATFCVSSFDSSGTNLYPGLVPPSLIFDLLVMSQLGNCLVTLECSLKILVDQISGILKKLSFVKLVPLASFFGSMSPVVSVFVVLVVNLDMALDNKPTVSAPLFSGADESTAVFSSSGSRVFTSKMNGLESKMSALKASVSSILVRLNFFINVPAKQADIVHWHVSFGNMISFVTEMKLRASSGPWIKNKAGITIIMNNSLARHVSKIEEVSGKLSVTLLGLYAGASPRIRFDQSFEVNFLIAKTVNFSSFVILGGDFNENGSGRSVSFKFCLDLGLVNSFFSHYLVRASIWSNSREVEKTIDYIFVVSVSDFFDTDHRAVVVSVGLDGLLDAELNSMCRQTNRNHWKFKIKDVNCAKWAKFKDFSLSKLLLLSNVFSGTENCSNVDAMWAVLEKILVESADASFLRQWFSKFDCAKNRHSSKFFGLELLVTKIIKKFRSGNLPDVDHLVRRWSTLDNDKAHAFVDLLRSRVKSDIILKHLLLVYRDYRKSKMFDSRLAKEASIRIVIEKCMENFCLNKDGIIRSVFEKPFCKVVLDHLVVDDKLVLEPEKMKSSTRKCSVHLVLSDFWACQYTPLDYVWDDAFSGIMCAVSIGKLLLVVGGLPNGKAVGLSSIPNELWKHDSEVVLECLLVLFNVCLSVSMVPVLWKRAWILTNIRPIALIETVRKILSKVLSDHILVAYDNFLVLKDIFTQSPVFAVRLVVEDVIEKNKENMQKAYDSVGWHHLRASLRHVKMYERFIKFFGGIHKDRINRIMTDFGLFGGYKGKVFSPLLWRIFYDPFLCEGGSGLTSYFLASAFVNNTIWVGNCQASTQYALNIASEFFVINDISINSKKTVAIPINQGVKVALLSICDQPISIAKKGKSHHYLGIFLSTEGLSKPSVVKAYADVCFFVNIVLRKTITDKQFSYLVLAVLQPIVSYHTQFSFISLSICRKWDVLVRKCLRSKAHLPHDFPDAALDHSLLYGLKPFKQVQSEEKMAALIVFSNASGIFGHLFSHRFLDLQVLGWALLDLLQFLVRLCINSVNNFLAGVVKIFLSNELPSHFLLSSILEKSLYFNSVKSLKHFGVAFSDQLFDKKGDLLNLHGLVPHWFAVFSEFLKGQDFSSSCSAGSDRLCGLDILGFGKFSTSGFFEVFTDGSLRNAGSVEVASGAAAYFLALDLSVGVAVHSLLSSIMAELQAVTLSLECILFSSTVVLHLDTQVAIDACVFELFLVCSDFCNQCWLERCYIFNLIRDKDLVVSWVKVKGHSGVSGNEKADLAARAASGSSFLLLAGVREHFLVVESTAVSGNAHHFVRDIFWSICHAYWEAGPDYDVIPDALIGCINWVVMAKVWHPDSHMLTGFTSCKSSMLRTYLMKAVHRRLPVAVKKRLYNKCYPDVLCLLCSGVKFPDHAFTCVHEFGIHDEILAEASAHWSVLAGVFNVSSSVVLWVLSQCSVNIGLYTLVCKGFVLNDWCQEACSVFDDRKVAVVRIVDFVKFVVELHRTKYDKTKPFFDFKTTIGSNIAVMEKIAKNSGFGRGFKPVPSRKKRKSIVLDKSIGVKVISAELSGGHLCRSETGNTTKSKSVDMEEECLVEKTSFDYGENSVLANGDPNQMPKSSKIKTKKTLGKPLKIINYATGSEDDDVLNESALLPPPSLIKPSVQISVRKSFALDIDLISITEKSFQEKLGFIRKIFSDVNGFGGASTFLKFGGVIHATFTSEKVMMNTANLANVHSVVVNTDLKHPVNNYTNWAIVLKEIPVGTSVKTVQAAVFAFGKIKAIKMQLTIIKLEDQDQANLLASEWSILIRKDAMQVARADIDKQLWNARDSYRTLLYTLPMRTTAHNLWNFIGSVDRKTCFIDRNPANYSHVHCATVCFSSKIELIKAMVATPVIKNVGLHWSCLSLTLCAVCRNFGHTSFSCKSVKDAVVLGARRAPLLAQNQLRLVKIYAKKSAPIFRALVFSGKTWMSVVRTLLTLLLSNRGLYVGSIVDGEPLPSTTSDLEKHLVNIESSLVSFTGQISELAKRLDSLMLILPELPVTPPSQNQEEDIVMRVSSGGVTSNETTTDTVVDPSASPYVVRLEKMLEGLSKSLLSLSLIWKVATYNVHEINNPTKQDNVVHWHKDMNNLISIVMDVQVFTFGLDSGYLGAGVVIIMNFFLAKYVCKFAQADVINSFIIKAVNESFFVVLGSDFNENRFCKCASFKKCLDLGLVNFLVGSETLKMPTWANSRGIRKTIDFMFISSNLVNVLVHCDVLDVSEHFNTDHQAVSVFLDLGGLLDMQLNFLCKQVNRDRWKFDFKSIDENK